MGRDRWDFSKVLKWYSNAHASESACFMLSNHTELIYIKKNHTHTHETKPKQKNNNNIQA